MEQNKKELKFELGKYYKHTAGTMIYICGVCLTKNYGMCLMAERDNGYFYPVGNHKGATDNWHEIKEEEFLNDRE